MALSTRLAIACDGLGAIRCDIRWFTAVELAEKGSFTAASTRAVSDEI